MIGHVVLRNYYTGQSEIEFKIEFKTKTSLIQNQLDPLDVVIARHLFYCDK